MWPLPPCLWPRNTKKSLRNSQNYSIITSFTLEEEKWQIHSTARSTSYLRQYLPSFREKHLQKQGGVKEGGLGKLLYQGMQNLLFHALSSWMLLTDTYRPAEKRTSLWGVHIKLTQPPLTRAPPLLCLSLIKARSSLLTQDYQLLPTSRASLAEKSQQRSQSHKTAEITSKCWEITELWGAVLVLQQDKGEPQDRPGKKPGCDLGGWASQVSGVLAAVPATAQSSFRNRVRSLTFRWAWFSWSRCKRIKNETSYQSTQDGENPSGWGRALHISRAMHSQLCKKTSLRSNGRRRIIHICIQQLSTPLQMFVVRLIPSICRVKAPVICLSWIPMLETRDSLLLH